MGDRTASVAAAASAEGGLSVLGDTLGAAGAAKVGGAFGVVGGPAGVAVGAAAGGGAEVSEGTWMGDAGWILGGTGLMGSTRT